MIAKFELKSESLKSENNKKEKEINKSKECSLYIITFADMPNFNSISFPYKFLL